MAKKKKSEEKKDGETNEKEAKKSDETGEEKDKLENGEGEKKSEEGESETGEAKVKPIYADKDIQYLYDELRVEGKTDTQARQIVTLLNR